MFIELGRLVREIEIKIVSVDNEEKSVINNRLAVNHDKENTSYIDLTAWGNTAELIAKYLKKGDEVMVEGELRNRAYKGCDKELMMPFILVTKVKFTHGNKTIENFI